MCRFRSSRRRLAHMRQVESLESRVLLAADFTLDALELALAPNSLTTQAVLSTVHNQTGVSYVRDTYGLTGAGQTVVVIDSGIAYDHVALGGGFGADYRVVGGWDFTEENDADPYDDGPAGFHGTHVAGIIGSDDSRHVGVAPGVDLIALRVFNDQGDGYFDWVESALEWVHDNRNSFEHPITTVNLSLGADWNSNSVPSWATLEDEFRQLRNDGIFVTAAAGNDFATYETIGLSYPAASPYVVPVSSIGSDGDLSDFSQRHLRALAAPGEQIVSTAPDYLFDFNGVTDDYATASGTSMAAPYLAGAGVLVREAMQLAGYSSITATGIYSVLRQNADPFYDSATDREFLQLNVSAAIDSILSPDDYGSTESTAHDLGAISTSTSISGNLERIDDADWFSFVADVGGRLNVSAASGLGSQLDVEVSGSSVSGNTGTDFYVESGEAYAIKVSSSNQVVGNYTLTIEMEEAADNQFGNDLGEVGFVGLTVPLRNNQVTWYRLTTTNAGILTAEVDVDSEFELYSVDGEELLARSSTKYGQYRVDWNTDANQTYLLKLTSDVNTIANVRIVNLVEIEASVLSVYGTEQAEAYHLALKPQNVWLSINGVSYWASGENTGDIRIDGGGGSDSIRVNSTNDDDTLKMWQGGATLSGRFETRLNDIESMRFNGRDGNDVATIWDGAGDDRFYSRDAYSFISYGGGEGIAYAAGFETVTARATSGGFDQSYLFDSVGDDELKIRPEHATIERPSTATTATGFDEVRSYSNLGGNDLAILFDTKGNDTFYGRRKTSYFVGLNYLALASTFEDVRAIASSGVDRAELRDTAGDEQFHSTPNRSVLTGEDYKIQVKAFDVVAAYADNGGNDTAQLDDGSGYDRLYVHPSSAWMVTDGGAVNYVAYFENLRVLSQSGTDLAFIHSGNEVDELELRESAVETHTNGNYNAASKLVAIEGDATPDEYVGPLPSSIGVTPTASNSNANLESIDSAIAYGFSDDERADDEADDSRRQRQVATARDIFFAALASGATK